MKIHELKRDLSDGKLDVTLEKIYGSSAAAVQRERYLAAVDSFMGLYPNRENIDIFSSPGRTEIGGNHTDHQHGCVLAAAINLDVIAVVAFHDEKVIRVKSKGHDMDVIELGSLGVQGEEYGTSAAIIRGIAAKFTEMGANIGGFDAYTTSDVLSGSGLSSSAAFETLLGTIIDERYNGPKAGAVEIAKIGQYAENIYFGKKSGLMDQMASSVGGLVFIDFNNTENPMIKRLDCDFERLGYSLCITDTKGSHADLIDDYSSIPFEMSRIAAYFGETHLRTVDEKDFLAELPELRGKVSDRAILRAAHFFNDNKNAVEETAALENDNIDKFLELVGQSGNSSYKLLQNIYSCKRPQEQGLALGIWASERVLNGRGAVRVHGGGFAGTIQAFVPRELESEYRTEMDRIFGAGSCKALRIRSYGGIKITADKDGE